MTLQSYVTQLLQHCGLAEDEITVSVEEDGDVIQVQLEVPSDEVGLFIGHRGEAISSLQRMARISFRDTHPDKVIRLNINDYREERYQQLQEKVLEIGQRVLETGEEYVFPYLSSYERFLVHSTISEQESLKGLTSSSEGDGNERRLVVHLAGEDLAEQDGATDVEDNTAVSEEVGQESYSSEVSQDSPVVEEEKQT